MRRNFKLALGIALVLDLVDFLGGFIPGAGDLIDLLGIFVLLPLIGSFALFPVLELLPLVDFLPFFVAAVLLSRKKLGRVPSAGGV